MRVVVHVRAYIYIYTNRNMHEYFLEDVMILEGATNISGGVT